MVNIRGFLAAKMVHIRGFLAAKMVHIRGFMAAKIVHIRGFMAAKMVHIRGFMPGGKSKKEINPPKSLKKKVIELIFFVLIHEMNS